MPVKVHILGKRHAGQTVAAVLTQSIGLSHAEVEHHLKNRWVRLDGELCRNAGQRVRAGQRLQVVIPRSSKRAPERPHGGLTPRRSPELPPLARAIHVCHLDDHIVIVHKPAGLTTVRHADETRAFGNRAKRFLPATLVDLLP
ncbi:MAG: hypothetical protein L0Y71_03960, partial [Gemmataceae bacterium]|nr:hypothetical protein [Gemmataceae bacterium]